MGVMRKHDLTNRKTMTKTMTNTFKEHIQRAIFETWPLRHLIRFFSEGGAPRGDNMTVTFPLTSARFSVSPHQWKQSLYSSAFVFQQIGRFTVSSSNGKVLETGKDLGPPIPESVSDTIQRYFIRKFVWMLPLSDINRTQLDCTAK